ncbi:MAG: ABC transporter ATP-binding protein [Granulosicoccus sp.]|nr:ABC transporter ATP-binding protein [Granulosicoccus sp.]
MSIDAGPVLVAHSIVAGYRPDLPILHGVSMHVHTGEIVTIIGPNGAGKSTFIKAIAGLVSVTTGKVMLDNRDITSIPAHLLAGIGVGYVPQRDNVFTTLTIHENLIMGSVTLKRKTAEQRIAEIYQRYPMLYERRQQKAAVLSGGQRQVLAVARALMNQPRLIMLDEPTAGLSPMAAEELFTAIRALAESEVAILMVEQNARAALRISDRAYILTEGHNRMDGNADSLLQNDEIGEIFLGGRKLAGNIH